MPKRKAFSNILRKLKDFFYFSPEEIAFFCCFVLAPFLILLVLLLVVNDPSEQNNTVDTRHECVVVETELVKLTGLDKVYVLTENCGELSMSSETFVKHPVIEGHFYDLVVKGATIRSAVESR